MSKVIFNNLLKNNYKIKKENNEFLYIFYNNNLDQKIKCKYSLLLIQKNITTETSLIVWADSNPYNDYLTREIAKKIRNLVIPKKNYIIDCNNQLIFKDDLNNLINYIIKNNYQINVKNDIINALWILSNNLIDHIEYYIITDILYY